MTETVKPEKRPDKEQTPAAQAEKEQEKQVQDGTENAS